MVEFKFPDVGEGITEGKLVKWMVKEGDSVKEDQILAEVETDKAVVEVPSPHTGTVSKLHAKEGDTIKVGAVIVTFDGGAAKEEKPEAKEAESAPQAPPEKSQPQNNEKPENQDTQEEPKQEEKETPVEPVVQQPKPEQKPTPHERPLQKPEAPKPPQEVAQKVASAMLPRPLATPHTRRLARELKVDIKNIKGSGPAGRITDDDVKAVAGGEQPSLTQEVPTQQEQPAQQATQPTAQTAIPTTPTQVQGSRREPLSPIRKAIANKMSESKNHAVHVTHCDEVDVTQLVKVRNSQKQGAKERGIKLTYLPFIAKAAIAALKKFPEFNASLDEATNELVFHERYDLGMALATDAGLLVPVVRNANTKSILQLAKEMHELADRGRVRKLKLEEMQGSTFTVTNVGSIGGTFFTPIINYPESAILGIGRIQELPRIINGQLKSRHILYLSLSFDHRVTDGARAALFVNEIKAHLEDPNLFLVDVL